MSKKGVHEIKTGIKTEDISDQKIFGAINVLIQEMMDKNNIEFSDVVKIIHDKIQSQQSLDIPCSILSQRPLGILEVVCKYYIEEKKMKNSEIARLLNRDQRTIWSAYHQASKKKSEKFVLKKNVINIPPTIFSDRNIGMLESLCIYLKDEKKMRYVEIGNLLQRDTRTIWASYNAGKKKIG